MQRFYTPIQEEKQEPQQQQPPQEQRMWISTSVFRPYLFQHLNQFFKETQEMNDNLALVEYSTTWCKACKSFDPELNRLALQYPYVAFAKVEIDKWVEQGIIEEPPFSAFPTFQFVYRGDIVYEIVGCDKNAICQFIETGKKKE